MVEVEDARCGRCHKSDQHQLHFSRHYHNDKYSSENEEKKVEDKKRRRKGRAGRKEEVRKRKLQDLIDFDRCAWMCWMCLDWGKVIGSFATMAGAVCSEGVVPDLSSCEIFVGENQIETKNTKI